MIAIILMVTIIALMLIIVSHYNSVNEIKERVYILLRQQIQMNSLNQCVLTEKIPSIFLRDLQIKLNISRI